MNESPATSAAVIPSVSKSSRVIAVVLSGIVQSVFVVTDDGVIVVDAPPAGFGNYKRAHFGGEI